jgi:exopolyphosphatase/guanosine-5'-triphosphate,3'-diphosphate pyrophosphatase
MFYKENKTGELCKKLNSVTKLSEGLNESKSLSAQAMERTGAAVTEFCGLAKEEGCREIFIFATEAVRKAENAREFTALIKRENGLDVEILKEKDEAACAFLGACGDFPYACGVIDIGGASTEIAIGANGKISFAQSVPAGAVRLAEKCGDDKACLTAEITGALKRFDKEEIKRRSVKGWYAVGGTPTQLSAIKQKLEAYEPAKIHNSRISKQEARGLADMILKTKAPERLKIKGLHPSRAPTIASGALMLALMMEYFEIEEITVSEKDNLEGYILLKR